MYSGRSDRIVELLNRQRVEHPHAATVRAGDQLSLAGMDGQVVDRNVRQPGARRLPAPAPVEGDVCTPIGPDVYHVGSHRIFTNDVDRLVG